MADLTFYQHFRMDGALRTGIELHDATVWHRFRKGKGPADPVLRWFVDVRCQGRKLPQTPEDARQWFLDNAGLFHQALRQLADELQGGMEPDVWPYSWNVPKPPAGVKITIVCSVMKRLDSVEIGRVLRDLAEQWEKRLGELRIHEAVST